LFAAMARRTAGDDGRIEVAVGVLVIERRMLLIQRSPRMTYGPLLWGCFGGTVEPGETLAAALIRETREEVGLEIDPIPRFLFETTHDPPKTERPVRVTFMRAQALDPISGEPFARIEDVELRIDPREIAGFGWFDAAEIAAMERGGRLTAANGSAADRLMRECAR
jgi:8-oxo-dGTP diphosphatase